MAADGSHVPAARAQALEHCEEALTYQEGYENALIQKGQCQMDLTDYAGAEATYTALERMPAAARGGGGGGADAQSPTRAHWTARREQARAMQDADPCSVLGLVEDAVEPPADEAAIKKAYRVQCLRWHPDKHAQGTDEAHRASHEFQRVADAYAMLSDPLRRAEYLARRRAAARREKRTAAPGATAATAAEAGVWQQAGKDHFSPFRRPSSAGTATGGEGEGAASPLPPGFAPPPGPSRTRTFTYGSGYDAEAGTAFSAGASGEGSGPEPEDALLRGFRPGAAWRRPPS